MDAFIYNLTKVYELQIASPKTEQFQEYIPSSYHDQQGMES